MSMNEGLEKLYKYLDEQKNQLNQYYTHLENKEYQKLQIIDDFATHLGIESIDDSVRLALITRVVNLRDDALVQILKKESFNEEQIIQKQEQAYMYCKDFWLNTHNKTLQFIKNEKVLPPFYTAIFQGVYNVGVCMSNWQTSWTKLIINTVNKDLMKMFDNDEQKVMQYLQENKLLDLGHDQEIADRCYSALIKDGNSYTSKAYIQAFKKEVTSVVDALEDFVDTLIDLEDDIYNQKWEYIQYLQTLIQAFSEDKTDKLVSKWADVDRAWMKITTPIQIGHPLEYYEDHFRKAVALEWDIRLSNPSLQNTNKRAKKLENMFEKIYSTFQTNAQYEKIKDFTQYSLNKVQLYIGRPALFFGAEFNGLFSAQVVPNDEVVSKEEGKKIFAFSDEILQIQRAKPFLRLSREILGQEFLTLERNFLFKETKNWHNVYDITTIGHEYGHILWCDDTTEAVMNKSGNFKNIEEFKATTGGLVSFFMDNEEEYLYEAVLRDTIKRAVGLIAWMEVDEVQPYYCEGLIHLSGLFESEVLTWDCNTLNINMSEQNYNLLKNWYIKTYTSLAAHYLEKKDATLWLNQFAKKDGKYYMPINENLKDFVSHYFKRYQEIGQEIDTIDKKENYYGN